METESRTVALESARTLTQVLREQPSSTSLAGLIEECEYLERAIAAFHMEAIRFRMYNVDRRLTLADHDVPPNARTIFEQMRTGLEQAGFHTRSH